MWKFGWQNNGSAFDVVIGASAGVAIGASVAISSRLWLRLLVASLLGYVAYLIAIKVGGEMIYGPSIYEPIDFKDAWPDYLSAVPAALLFTFFDHMLLKWRKKNARFLFLVGLLFATIGVAAPLLHFHRDGHGGMGFYFGIVWGAHEVVSGAAFGAMQFLSLLAALALDRKLRPRLEPPPSAPSPGPGP